MNGLNLQAGQDCKMALTTSAQVLKTLQSTCRCSSWGVPTGPTSCSPPSTSLSAQTSLGSTALPLQLPAGCNSWEPSPMATGTLPQLLTPCPAPTFRTSECCVCVCVDVCGCTFFGCGSLHNQVACSDMQNTKGLPPKLQKQYLPSPTLQQSRSPSPHQS